MSKKKKEEKKKRKKIRKYAHFLQKNYIALQIIDVCRRVESSFSRGRKYAPLLQRSYISL